MKKFLAYTLYTLLLSAVVCACSDDLDVQQVYGFDLETMPVPKKIKEGESAEIRCKIVREGEYAGTDYKIRYFLYDGAGELALDNGTRLTPNDLYPLDRLEFRLYYRSFSSDQHNFDVFIVDSHNQIVQKSFSFQNDGDDEKSEDSKDEE